MSLTVEQMNERDQIMFGTSFNMQNYRGGIRYFAVPPDTIDRLIEKDYISITDRKNNHAPTVSQFLGFCRDIRNADICKWLLHGFAESPARADSRIIIEGIQGMGPFTLELRERFLETFHDAAELSEGENDLPWCWYD